MATVVPAIKGRMGSIDYYETVMTATELASSTRTASDIDGWANRSVEDRIQREVNENRIRDEIVPYLRQEKDRFFGALIVLVMDGELEFEPITDFGPKLPVAQRGVARRMGFLNISGGERVALDGQHRLVALREVLTGRAKTATDDGRPDYTSEVASDELCVIFIEWIDNETTRRIFTKVNRTARAPSRADNIILSEDDSFAILTRWLMRPQNPLGVTKNGDLIVNWKSNTIATRSIKLTTVSAVYESVKDILEANGGFPDLMDERKGIVRAREERLELAYEEVREWWEMLLAGITPFRKAIEDPSRLPRLREDLRTKLVLRPNGQQALVKGLARAVANGADLETAIARADRINWGSTRIWGNVLIKPGGAMIARAESYNLAADLISYMVYKEGLPAAKRAAIKRDYAIMKGRAKADTPRSEVPNLLPKPIA